MKKLILILCALSLLSPFAYGTERNRHFLYYSKIQEHTLTDLSFYDALIGIEDGSYFKVSSSNLRKVVEWRPGDSIVITPRFYYFSSAYTYSLHNTTLDVSVAANLDIGPLIGNRFAKQIDQLDYRKGLVVLTDGSCFAIRSLDDAKFIKWQEGDYIIIGSSHHLSYKNILINVNLDHYVHAKYLE